MSLSRSLTFSLPLHLFILTLPLQRKFKELPASHRDIRERELFLKSPRHNFSAALEINPCFYAAAHSNNDYNTMQNELFFNKALIWILISQLEIQVRKF